MAPATKYGGKIAVYQPVAVASKLGLRTIAERAEVRHHPDVPEHDRDRRVRRYREHVPHERRPELRPHRHRQRHRKQPVSQPRTADVDDRKERGAGHGEDRHRLGETADRIPPALFEEQQNGRDQRTGVADTDPPDEVDDREAPRDRHRNGPDADAHQEQPKYRHQQYGGSTAGDCEQGKPAERRVRGEHNARDLLSDRTEGLAGRDNAIFPGGGINAVVDIDFAGCHRGFNPWPVRASPALLRVRNSDSALQPHTWCADACSVQPEPSTRAALRVAWPLGCPCRFCCRR